ncbi:hypothetical protein [Streptomyces sp. NBC_01334]|uniref:hypothetical protein n=1 Tax=Streptomyces sp. NBC_01334 TaxID=2903827 RepID=UPI002E10E530|nr:hypothetical protein OG736_01280 [Streptomyces sp. NBC_01334]
MLRSGTHINCTGEEATAPNLRAAIEAGVLSEGVIDGALVHLFTLRMRTGEFDAPEKVPYTNIGKDVIESRDHRELARKVADNALVLLQNDKEQQDAAEQGTVLGLPQAGGQRLAGAEPSAQVKAGGATRPGPSG